MRAILNFIFCLAIALAITFLITGSGGIFVIMTLLVALIFSIFIVFNTRRTLKCNVKLSSETVSKGEDFYVEIVLNKSSFLPTCFLEFEIGRSLNISSDKSLTFRLISAQRDLEKIKIPLRADYCGEGSVFIRSITLVDYLGVYKKKMDLDNESVKYIKVLPSIPDTGTQIEVIKSASANMSFDDSDEETNETSLGLTGVAGYDHRQYVEGDPLKRINWKMSSKRNILMVRLDEKVASASLVFRLDYPQYNDGGMEYVTNSDRIIEASLAMLAMLLEQGYESEYNYYLDGWQTLEIKDDKTLIYLQEQLGGIRPYSEQQRFPDKNINSKNKSEICFTTCTRTMVKQISEFVEGFNGSLVVTKESGLDSIFPDMWTVNSDFEFEKLQGGS